MFSPPLKRMICTLLAICLAMASTLASAGNHADAHEHSHDAVATIALHDHDAAPHSHDHEASADCGFGECVTCHLFCHASALLPSISNVQASRAMHVAFFKVETPLPLGSIGRIERPNW
jgi:hypothetical protein